MKIPESLRTRLTNLAYESIITERDPDFVIGGVEDPYICRWFLNKKNRYGKAYLHRQLRDDEDRALHDHPWINCSIILEGGYNEYVPVSKSNPAGPSHAILRRPGSVIVRLPSEPHRLALQRTPDGKIVPSLSLFLMGPNVREWGFWCPQGWRPWFEFTDDTSAKVGKGCD